MVERTVTKRELDRVWTHIEKTNSELGEVCARVSGIEANVSWIKWLSSITLASILGLSIYIIQAVI